MRRRLSNPRKKRAGFTSAAVLAAGLAFTPYCATAPKKTPVKAAKAEPETVVDFPIIVRRRDWPIRKPTRETPRFRKKVHMLKVGDRVKLWPGEAPIKVTMITPKEIRFSDGTRLECGESYHYIDIKLYVRVTNMNPAERSVTIIVAKERK